MEVLSTAVVNVKDSQGRIHQCRALLDSASQLNLVSRNLAERLGLKLNWHSVPITGISKVLATESFHFCQLQITSTVRSYTNRITCSVLPLITGSLPSSRINCENWELPADVPLADPHFYQPSGIDLLLGTTVFFEVLRTEQRFRRGTQHSRTLNLAGSCLDVYLHIPWGSGRRQQSHC
jgi:hypothetical protein